MKDDASARMMVPAGQGCAGHIDSGVSRVVNAATNGTPTQINSALMNLLPSENDLAAVVVREMACVMLHHQKRMTAAKVSRRLLHYFRRKARLIR